MKEIKNFEEIIEIQDKKLKTAEIYDLLFVRKAYIIIDGYVLMIGADCKESLELFYLSHETYSTFYATEKEYLKRWYGGME